MSTERVVISARILGQLQQNVLHFDNPDGSMAPDAIAAELTANWIAQLRNVQNANLLYSMISVQKVFPLGDRFEFAVAPGTAGTLLGQPAPLVCSAIFRIRTATATRHGHGRFYMMGLHGESVQNSLVQPAALGAIQFVANQLVARYGDSGSSPLTLVVCPRNSPGDIHMCTHIVVPPELGTQRRRNIGVGG